MRVLHASFASIAALVILGGSASADGLELDNGFFKRWYSKETRRSFSEPVSLKRVAANPENYRNVYFRAWVRFHREEQISIPEFSRFNERNMNFSVWPADAKLWIEKERLADFPFLYALKDDKMPYQLSQLKKYDLVLIFARVHGKFQGRPLIEVLRIDKEAKSTLSDALLTHISVAESLEGDRWYREANDEYSRVQRYDLMPSLAAEMWKRKGKNFINAQMPSEASYSLLKSIEIDNKDYESHLWLAESLTQEGKSAKALTAARRALRLRGRLARAYALIGHAVQVLALQELDALGIDMSNEASTDLKRKRESVRPRYRYGSRRYTKADVARSDVSYYISQKDKDRILAFLNTALREGRKAVYLDGSDAQASRWLDATKKAIAEFDARLSRVENARAGDGETGTDGGEDTGEDAGKSDDGDKAAKK